MNIWSIVIEFAVRIISEIIDPAPKKSSLSKTEELLRLIQRIDNETGKITKRSDRVVVENGKYRIKRSEHKNDFFGQGDHSDLDNEEFWGKGGFWGDSDNKKLKKKKKKLEDEAERLKNEVDKLERVANELKNKTTEINLDKVFSRKSKYATVKSGDNINVKESIH